MVPLFFDLPASLSCRVNAELALGLLPLVIAPMEGSTLATPPQDWAAHRGVIQQGDFGISMFEAVGSRLHLLGHGAVHS